MSIKKATWREWRRINEIIQQELPVVTSSERRYMILALLDGTWVWKPEELVSAIVMVDNKKFPSVCWLEYLAVSHRYKGQGIGSKLLRHSENIARKNGKDWLALSTYKNNTEAIPFYEHLGFLSRPDIDDEKIVFSKSLNGNVAMPDLIPTQIHPSKIAMGVRRGIFDYLV